MRRRAQAPGKMRLSPNPDRPHEPWKRRPDVLHVIPEFTFHGVPNGRRMIRSAGSRVSHASLDNESFRDAMERGAVIPARRRQHQKRRTLFGAQSGSILILIVPRVVFMLTVFRISSIVAFANGSFFLGSIVTVMMWTGCWSAPPDRQALAKCAPRHQFLPSRGRRRSTCHREQAAG